MGLRRREDASSRTGSVLLRTPATWAAYLMLGLFGYQETVLGPIMPFLRHDLNLTYAAAGLHFSAFAAGAVVAGLVGGRAIGRLGRDRSFWGGAAGMILGGVALMVVRHVAGTVAAAAMMGLCGTLTVITIQAALAQEHTTRRAQAVTEANVMASIGGSLAALVVGAVAASAAGWRAALVLPVVLLAVLSMRFAGVRFLAPPPVRAGTGPATRLPLLFWAFWAVIVLGVAAEWCMAYWGTDYLHKVAGLPVTTAAALMGAYLGAGALGRAVASGTSAIK
jgi:MFS family permease